MAVLSRPLSTFLLLGLVACALPAWAGVPAPLGGSGSFAFSADLPVFPSSSGPRLDLAAVVYHPQIEFVPGAEGRYHARVQMSLKLARQGRVAVDSTEVYDLVAADRAASLRATAFGLLEMSVPVEPGRWAVTIELRDLMRERSSPAAGEVLSRAEGVLLVREDLGEGPMLSDPEFRLRDANGGLLPHPERLYGITQDTLEAYLEIQGATPGRSYAVEIVVTDPLYGGMDSQVLTLQPTKPHAATVYRLPLQTFPAGSYVMSLRPQWRPQDAVDAEFGVSWSMDRVVQVGRDLKVEATLVLEADELDRFERLSRPSQIQMLQDFWTRLDPTPGTDRNEVYERFLSRLSHCYRNYGHTGLVGPLTDRGRTYMRYGPPATVTVEVVPLNDDELDLAIGKVHDTYQMDREGVWAKDFNPLILTEREETSIDQRRNQARVGKEGAFELWQYAFHGRPLLGEVASWSENVDLRFLFVDRLGDGVYRLEYTNLPVTN